MAKLASLIKYEGDNSTFVWKSPIEDFNTNSQLIVHETQEAVFFKNGQALDIFPAGKYTLKTENIPFLKTLLNLPTAGKTPFHCEIYFINKAHQMAIKWGTDGQVQYMEPTYKFPLQIGISGEMILSVADSKKLLVKIVGTEKILTHQGLTNKFRSILMSKIKPYIASTMQNADYSIFEIDSHMDELSSSLLHNLTTDFAEYGINLENFFVTNIAKPNGDTAYEKFKNLHIRQYSDVAEAKLQQTLGLINEETEKQRKIIEAEGIAEKRKIEGYTYAQERGFDVAEKIADNEGTGTFSNLGIGLGIMGGISGTVAGMTGEALDSVNTQNTDNMHVFKEKIKKLMIMKEMGVLTEEEFNEEKKKFLQSL